MLKICLIHVALTPVRCRKKRVHAYSGSYLSPGNPYGNEPLQDLRAKTLAKTHRLIPADRRYGNRGAVLRLQVDLRQPIVCGVLYWTGSCLPCCFWPFWQPMSSVTILRQSGIRSALHCRISYRFRLRSSALSVRLSASKEPVSDSRKLFDIGIAGPIAGFVVSLTVLLIGFATLPGPEFIMNFPGHEDVKAYVAEHNAWPDEPLPDAQGELLVLGNTLLYSFLASFFENAPPMWEMYHYPFLFAGWLGLFFTALNLMPVGQLDGGHIMYCLIGYRKHRIFARVFFITLVTLGGVGAVPVLHMLLESYDNHFATLSWSVMGTGSLHDASPRASGRLAMGDSRLDCGIFRCVLPRLRSSGI